MKEFVLEAVNITKRFPGVLANDNVCLNVRYGEILGLIGENGAGKSVLLKILNGIFSSGSYEGNLFLEGKSFKPTSPHDAIQKGIGYVPQETNVLMNFSVAENIFMSNLRLNNFGEIDKNPLALVDFRKVNEACSELLEKNKIDLNPRWDVRKLSIGQQQMLMIARALSTEPKVLILDEPTTSLSASDVESLFRVVRTLKENGTSIIFVTHKLDEILSLTDRVTILRDGKNINTYEKEDYVSNRIISDMIGREISDMYPSRNTEIGDEVFRVENIVIEHPYIANRNLIQDISFSVNSGEVLGLGGLVGAGRSELCLGLYGMMPIKSGTIYLNNEEIVVNSSEDAIKHRIGMVSEDRKVFGLNFNWDIKNNIIISNLNAISKWFLVKKQKIVERALPYFEKMRIKAPSINTRVASLSGGNQQKVVIARTLNAEPKIVILDEPTKGIDVGSKNEIYQLINNLSAEGVSVILISSDLPELIALSDRCIIMAEGRIAGELRKEEITDMRVMQLATKTFK